MLKAFSMLHDRGIIFFFIGISFLKDMLRQWLDATMGRYSVEDVIKVLIIF